MQDFSPVDTFQPALMPGERVLWTGRPKQGWLLSGRDAFLIPFSVMWGGFAIFWNAGVWGITGTGSAAPLFFKLWGLPFLVIGVYFVVGRFIHDAAVRRDIAYAVTDKRVLVRRGANSGRIRSLDIAHLPRLELEEHRDGTGTIEFENESPAFGGRNGFAYWAPALSKTMRLVHIDEPRRVYELIRNHARR